MAKRRSSRNDDIGTLIGLVVVFFALVYVFWSQIVAWFETLVNAMIQNIIAFLIGLGEFLLEVGLPLYLGYLAGNKLLERQYITSGWGIALCIIFLILFSYVGSGLTGIFIGLIAWGIIGAFAIDKWNDAGLSF